MSKPLGKIIAATGLSAPSLHAVDRAFLIASQAGAACSIVHALGLDAWRPHAALRRAAARGSRALAPGRNSSPRAARVMASRQG